MKRFYYILLTIVLLAIQSMAQAQYVIDKVCKDAVRTYRVDQGNGDPVKVYTWMLTDKNGNLLSIPSGSILPDGSEITITWSFNPDVYTLKVEKASEFKCSVEELGTVEVIPKPFVDAGPDQMICAGGVVNLIDAKVQDITEAGIEWITNGDGSFDNPSSVNPNYTPGAGDILAGKVTLKLTAKSLTDDGDGCFQEDEIEIRILAQPNLIVKSLPVSCEYIDLADAIDASGIIPPGAIITYWDATLTQQLSGSKVLATGTYYIKIGVGNLCIDSKPVDATVLPVPRLDITNPPAVCEPATVDISTVYSADAGTAITFYQDSGATITLTSTIISESGTYYIKADNGGPCPAIKPVSVVVNKHVTPQFSLRNTYCLNEIISTLPTISNDGIKGTWNPASISTSTAGSNYVYIFTPDDICFNTYSLTVEITNPVTPTFDPIGPVCQNAPSPLPAVSKENISGKWSPAFSSGTETSTTYTFTPDLLECANSVSVTVDVKYCYVPLAVSTVYKVETCPGSGDATATAIPSGGTPPYTYVWNNGQTGQTASGLTAGIYNVTVTDADGAIAPASVLIPNATSTFGFDPKINQPCWGEKGSIEFFFTNVPNDLGLIDIYYDGGKFADVKIVNNYVKVDNVEVGTYNNVRVQINGCWSQSIPLTVKYPEYTLSAVGIDPVCDGKDGIIQLNFTYVLDGMYEVLYDNGSFGMVEVKGGQAKVPAPPGTYQNLKVIIDPCPISFGTPIVINNALPLTLDATVTPPTCNVPLGTIEVISPLGNNYQYSSDGGTTYQTSPVFSGLNPGDTYLMKVKDITVDCESPEKPYTVDLLPVIPDSPVVAVTQPTCYVPTGSIQVTSPLGNNYQYSIDGNAFQLSAIFSSLNPGSNHLLKIKDVSTGCESTGSIVTIDLIPGNPATPSVTVTANPSCDNPDGIITVVSPLNAGGTTYSYSRDGINFQQSPIFENVIGTNTYTITVRDEITGCTSSSLPIYVPSVPPTPMITSISKIDPSCYGEMYTITLSVINTPDGIYNVIWDGGSQNVEIKGGTATITGQLTEDSKDFNNIRYMANGCWSKGINNNISIKNPDLIVVYIVKVTEQAVKGTQMGAIDIDAYGGFGDLKYLWSNGGITQDLDPVSYGTYTVTVSDSRNCWVPLTVKVPLNNPPVARPDEFAITCLTLTGNLLSENGAGKDYDPDPVEQNDFITINTNLVVKPLHAENWKINSDGTFEYVAQSNYTGDDFFVYEIYDKLKQTATATVTIHISSDMDGDGITDLDDPDADGDGILNVNEVLAGQDWKTTDSDGDGYPNALDIDSDGDGIVDNIESQSSKDYIKLSLADSNHNGIDDVYDAATGETLIVPIDTDADGIPDFLDTDSDNDLVPDYIEGHDLNADGSPDRIFVGKDADHDGLDDSFDIFVNVCEPSENVIGSNAPKQDFDGDGMNDWRDENDDNDEYLTRFEDLNMDRDFSNDDTDFDGHPEYLDYGRDCDLFVPDAFSPNDDNIHDYFQVYCIDHFPNAQMFIFDQLGNKLFEKNNYGNLQVWGSPDRAWWDGRTTNRAASTNGGKVVPGTYYYVLRLGNGDVRKSFVFVSY